MTQEIVQKDLEQQERRRDWQGGAAALQVGANSTSRRHVAQ